MRGTRLGITYLVRKIKFKLLFQGPLAKWVVPHGNQICGSSRGHEHWRKEKEAKEDLWKEKMLAIHSCWVDLGERCVHVGVLSLKVVIIQLATSSKHLQVLVNQTLWTLENGDAQESRESKRKNIRGMRMMLMLSKRSMRRRLNRTYTCVPRPKQSMQKEWVLVFLMQCLFDLSAEVRWMRSCRRKFWFWKVGYGWWGEDIRKLRLDETMSLWV